MMNTSALDMEVPITEESGEQVLRIPAAFRLSSSRAHLHRDSIDGPITLSPSRNKEIGSEQRQQSLKELFAAIDAARESGETLEMEREFCPPRDVEI
jgi:hypothetical protein